MVRKKEFSKVTLDNISGGALPERFDAAMADVIANIQDPNTDLKQARKIMIVIEVRTDEKRGTLYTRSKVSKTLATLKPVDDTLFLGRQDGQVGAFTFDPEQMDIESNGAHDGVLPLGTSRAAQGAQ